VSDDEIIDGEIVGTGHDLEPTSPLPQRSDAVLAMRHAITRLDDQRADLEAAGDVDSLAYGAADVALLKRDLGTLERATKASIAHVLIGELMAEIDEAREAGESERRLTAMARRRPKREVEGLGRVEVPGGNERKNWDSPRLLRDLMLQAVVDPDTGELREFPSGPAMVDAIYEVIAKCLPITGSLSWRVGSLDKATNEFTGLRGQGIDPDDYSDNIEKDRLAVVPKHKETK
jgi:hypothetical protein